MLKGQFSPGNPVKLSKMAEGPWSRVPWCGEHTVELLAELGLAIGDIERLVEARVVGSPQPQRELSSVPGVPVP